MSKFFKISTIFTTIALILLCSCLKPDLKKTIETAFEGEIIARNGLYGRWSPDGKEVVFSSFNMGKRFENEIFILSLSNNQLKQITKNKFADSKPAISPDGNYIACVMQDKGKENIWLYDLKTGDARQLTVLGGDFPDFHPDGKRIAFSAFRDGSINIYEMDITSGAYRQIVEDRADEWNPRWSKDGQKLAFVTNRNDNDDIWILDMEAKQYFQITYTESNERYPCWSPDGTYIAFCSDKALGTNSKSRANSVNIWVAYVRDLINAYVIGPITSEKKPSHQFLYPDWSPDGEKILISTNITGYNWCLGYVKAEIPLSALDKNK